MPPEVNRAGAGGGRKAPNDSESNIDQLPRRTLARANVSVPALIWLIEADRCTQDSDALLADVVCAGAEWFYLPARLERSSIRTFVHLLASAGIARSSGGRGACANDSTSEKNPGNTVPTFTPRIVLGLDVDDLEARGADGARERLEALESFACEAAMLEGASSGQLKSGRAFARLSRLRQDERVNLLFLDAEDATSAAWMVENTPAHAVCLPFGLADQTASYALLAIVRDLGTALLARPPVAALWAPPRRIECEADLSFRLGTAELSASLESLPRSVEHLQALLKTSHHPMSEAERSEWWSAFKDQVPAPTNQKGAHPPEFG